MPRKAPPSPPERAPRAPAAPAATTHPHVAPAAPPVLRDRHVGLPIYKMSGSGNDFVMLDARLSQPGEWTPADIRAVCARGTGIGADGLVFVGPGSQDRAARMVYFNADGSRAPMCGNAALCTTRLAARLGIAPAEGMRLETDAGVYESRCAGAGAEAELHLAPVTTPADVPGIVPAPGERRIALGVVGVPHLVVLVDDVATVDVTARGRELRFDPALAPGGANINFVSPGTSSSEWWLRTYERGVEAETLACGTGAVAAACALSDWGLASLPLTVWSRSGRPLGVRARQAAPGHYDDVWLAGEAHLVFRGVLA
ncbi:MAG TPA: diaminopimelate epimerase [Gemmatimonadales bacterium]|nr:diaminopimelate epimerase [Gemmatimonadales bacterium]